MTSEREYKEKQKAAIAKIITKVTPQLEINFDANHGSYLKVNHLGKQHKFMLSDSNYLGTRS